ncbi:protein toll-like [Uranotaenia lowii]|uniref:protein toll-like n=1 Tax=Uranotaenia lowii TaxID=190385 RepID=UPI00247851F2|nr:protein toll-like [Uranotaenia lowii]
MGVNHYANKLIESFQSCSSPVAMIKFASLIAVVLIARVPVVDGQGWQQENFLVRCARLKQLQNFNCSCQNLDDAFGLICDDFSAIVDSNFRWVKISCSDPDQEFGEFTAEKIMSAVFTMDVEINDCMVLGTVDKCDDFLGRFIEVAHVHTLTVASTSGLKIEITDQFFAGFDHVEVLDLREVISDIKEEAFEENDLIQLKLDDNGISSVRWFKTLHSLEFLSLSNNRLQFLDFSLVDGRNSVLRHLNLSRNLIVTLDENAFSSLKELIILDLSFNQLRSVNKRSFAALQELESLLLEGNMLTSLPDAIITFSNVKQIDISSNDFAQMTNFCRIFTEKTIQIIEELSLRNNSVDMIPRCLESMKSLKKLDFGYNNISFFGCESMGSSSFDLQIKLNNNNIKQLNLDHSCVFARDGRPMVTLDLNGNPIQCDCSARNILQMMRMNSSAVQFDISKLYCHDPADFYNTPFSNLKLESLSCTLNFECPQECTCFELEYNATVSINCSSQGLKYLPDLSEIDPWLDIELDLSHNLIEDLTIGSFQRVQRIDLTDNKLSSVAAIARMINQSNPHTTMFLEKNVFTCNCESIDALRYIQNHKHQIVEYDQLVCSNGRELHLLTLNDLCLSSSTSTFYIAIISFTSLSAIISMLLLYRHYQTMIKAFLYSQNLCLRWITEQDPDQDRPYDAFLVYAHQDEKFVLDVLANTLELDPYNFRLCIHLRDWTPGELILDQIKGSVESSRRTLVVLSENLLNSTWGQLEFRTAYTSQLHEGRSRVIVIVYGDLDQLKSQLEDDWVRAYLNFNTFVKWSDPWFWEKLRYAMPHKQLEGVRNRDQRLPEVFQLYSTA